MDQLTFTTNQISGVKPERVTIDGREFLRVPAVGVVEMVLNGRYLPAAEILASLPGWDGVPIPLDHPQVNGEFVSATHPDAQGAIVGYWGDTRADGAKLKGNMYIDLTKAAESNDGAALVTRLKAGEMVELSTAYFANEEEQAGYYAAKPYTAISRNLRPDHVALLLHKPGACSIKDGCGALRLNADSTLAEARKGIMVALFLPIEDARLLDLPEGVLPAGSEPMPAAEMHITLAYLGETDNTGADEAQIKGVLARLAADTEPFPVRIGGIGRFAKADSDRNAIYAQVDSRQLMKWRERLVSDLMFDAEAMPSMRHGFTPHVTLAYVPAGSAVTLPPPVEREILLDRLALAWGGQRTEYQLKPAALQANSKEEPEMDPKEKAKVEDAEKDAEAKAEPPVANAAKTEPKQEKPAAPPATITVNAEDWGRMNERLGALDKFLGDHGGFDGVAKTLAAASADHQVIVANEKREKDDLIAVLTANQSDLTKEDLEALPSATLHKLARAIGRSQPAQVDYSGRGLTYNAQSDEGWVDYDAPTASKEE